VHDVPVERRTYYEHAEPDPTTSRVCAVCGRKTMVPWYLRRDLERRVWRRWVCLSCQAHQDLPEQESA
jgi:transposase